MSDRFHYVWIASANFDASLAFYRDVLGWSEVGSWNGPGTMLCGGGMTVVIAKAAGGGRGEIHLDIHDVEARFRVLPKGEHVVSTPEDQASGRRGFVVRDPDGNLIAFEELHEGG